MLCDTEEMKINSEYFKTTAHIKTNIRLLENVQEYMDVIEYLRQGFDTSNLWYRGVSHAKYELIPKAYRDRLWQRHENYEWWIFSSFVNRARSFIPDHSNYTQWNWYFTMQHYGLPTRLLDWTEGSLIALYFAVRNPKNTYIPSIYVLYPYWFDEVLNDQKKEEGIVYSTDPVIISEEHNKLLSSYLESDSECPCFPLCLEPPATDLRMTAQRSVFTIHGVNINAFRLVAKNNAEPHMAKIRFSTKHAAYIKDQLNAMGITESTLFPELEGLCRDLKWTFRIE